MVDDLAGLVTDGRSLCQWPLRWGFLSDGEGKCEELLLLLNTVTTVMFRSLLRDFDDDSFFSDPFIAHQEHVRQMMRSFSDPFGRDPFLSITDGRSRGRRGQPGSQVALREDHRASSLTTMPTASFTGMSSDFRDVFHSMDSMMEGLSEDSGAHSFKSSSVMTYSKTGDEPAKVFQSTSQTSRAPGGIKETKKAIRDSESGIEKMAIGHHIQDRAHIIQKSRNHKTGDQELNQEFLNLDEAEGPSFDDEWQREVSKFKSFKSFPGPAIEAPKHRSVKHIAGKSQLQLPAREK
ncbi:myeloid leukemia factor 1 L homeolog isoform X2 [Xenopus laevis]|uniref:Myeloid leukemia factor 1 L homeolog isoform X2 n=1 Tax=Xenopus laevis TaxID=8355 RepID=A0A8J1KLM6_XENLA|nr:myeloid leukemia factor 1 L homeolog isoform X2 [Xenopus laevis]